MGRGSSGLRLAALRWRTSHSSLASCSGVRRAANHTAFSQFSWGVRIPLAQPAHTEVPKTIPPTGAPERFAGDSHDELPSTPTCCDWPRVHLCWSAAVSGSGRDVASLLNAPVDDLVPRVVNENQGQWADRLGGPPSQVRTPPEGTGQKVGPNDEQPGRTPVCTSMSLMHRCTASYVRRRYRGWVRTVVERRKPLPGVPFRPRHPPCGTPTSLPSEHTSRRRCTGRSSCRRRAD